MTPTDSRPTSPATWREDAGLSIDTVGFEAAMQAQREASRAGGGFKDTARHRAEMYVQAAGRKTEFLGYDKLTAEANVLALIGPDGPIDEVGRRTVGRSHPGSHTVLRRVRRSDRRHRPYPHRNRSD